MSRICLMVLMEKSNPRFVLFPQELKISKSMKKILNSNLFTFTENKCFEEVIRNCQKMKRKGQEGTWISEEMVEAYVRLNQLGVAKSIEVWQVSSFNRIVGPI